MYKYTSNPDRAIALADCNNFFASCERRVNPLLENRPVVVLSCNDGCVIARSNEVKKIGIKMGEPYFRIKDTLKYYNVAVRSTNMPLYQEVSAEVMARIKIYTDAIEQYSIDECFFNMGIANITDPVAYCLRIRKDILCKCRIPVSIGIAPTKTLCKLAAEYAKHHDDSGGVYWLSSEKYNDYDYMSQFKCGDVWGIGNKTEKKLALQGVRNAAEFTRLDEVRVLKEYSVRGLFTLWELRGRPSIPFELERKPQKSIMVSRSFGNVLHTEYELLDPLWCFVVAAGRQLRKEGLAAGKLAVYIMTSWFAPEDRRYYKSAEVVFQTPKFLDYDLMTAAASAMRQIYVRGYDYKKCGVYLYDLSDVSSGIQMSLFTDDEELDRGARLAAVVDKLNTKFGRVMIKPAALYTAPGCGRIWQPKAEFRTGGGIGAPLERVRFQSHAEDYMV